MITVDILLRKTYTTSKRMVFNDQRHLDNYVSKMQKYGYKIDIYYPQTTSTK